MSLTELVIKLTAIGTVAAIIMVLVWIISYLTGKRHNTLVRHMGRHGLLYAFGISLAATLGSLYFSLVAHYAPCSLCWVQRVFMFPLPVILGLGILGDDRQHAPRYVLALSGLGALVALYHLYLQYAGAPLGSCGVGPGVISCATRLVFEFGFVTIPLMTLAAFALIIIAMVSVKTTRSE